MAAVHILIFGEMAGFKIVPFIATQVKMKHFFHSAMKKIFQKSPICMKTTDNIYIGKAYRRAALEVCSWWM